VCVCMPGGACVGVCGGEHCGRAPPRCRLHAARLSCAPVLRALSLAPLPRSPAPPPRAACTCHAPHAYHAPATHDAWCHPPPAPSQLLPRGGGRLPGEAPVVALRHAIPRLYDCLSVCLCDCQTSVFHPPTHPGSGLLTNHHHHHPAALVRRPEGPPPPRLPLRVLRPTAPRAHRAVGAAVRTSL
jgi:hypothetical protein